MQALRSTRLASAQKADFMAGSELLVDILQHFVGCGNHLAVHFVGALCLDHVDQFLDDIDVRSFKRALADGSEEHTSELQSLMRHSSAVSCLEKCSSEISTLSLSITTILQNHGYGQRNPRT